MLKKILKKPFQEQKERISSLGIPNTIQQIWAAFSGGHDSLVATHYISSHPLFKGVLHIDTGIGIPETQEYVKQICSDYNWELKIYKAAEYINGKGILSPQIYENLVDKLGFPGANLHNLFYNRLKELPIRQFIRENKASKNNPSIALSTGIRWQESWRSPRSKEKIIAQNTVPKSAIFVAPIIDFSEEDICKYIKENNLPRNPVKEALCMSGECLCGAYAKQNELLAIEIHYPEVAKRIKELEDKIKDKFPWGWEDQPPQWWREKKKKERLEKDGQLNLFCVGCASR